MDFIVTVRKNLGTIGGASHLLHLVAISLGVVALALGAMSVPLGIPFITDDDKLFEKMFYVNAGVIGLLAIDFAYLDHVRGMRSEVFNLIRAGSGKLSHDNAPELFAILNSVTAYIIYHVLVFLALMYVMGAIGSAVQVRNWRYFVIGIGGMVGVLHTLHYWTTTTSLKAVRGMLK